VVTADALNCQKAIAAQIVAGGGDYVLALKDNHPHLSEDVHACLTRLEAARFPDRVLCRDTATDYGHGRVETRVCTCLFLEENDPNWQDIQAQWSGLRALVKVERRVQRQEKSQREVAYFLSSLSEDAARLAHSIRSHWHIENRLHWVLDVVFDEDACRVRRDHGAQNLAVLRHLALNQLRRETSKNSLKGKQQMAGWDEEFLFRVLKA
jgi:predicted transposase YbfD/YdcC